MDKIDLLEEKIHAAAKQIRELKEKSLKAQEIYRKLDTFENLYQMVYEKVNGYYMMIIELGVFLLIVWEVIAALIKI